MTKVELTEFGLMPNGDPVHSIVLNNGKLSCEIITYGAALRTLFVPDRDGTPTDIVLGYDTLAQYIQEDGYFGATIGRVANRIAKGTFSLNGKTYTLPINDGSNHHHGGPVGFSHRNWNVVQATQDSVTLELASQDGEQGYPGNLKATAEYTLRDNALIIRHTAIADKDTLCSLTNHSYFNLGGHNSGSAMGQNILLFAHEYTPSNNEGIPLGNIAPVDGTPMDLRVMVPIKAHIADQFQQLQQAGGYDHNYVVNGSCGVLRSAAMASSELTGIAMQVDTTMPGIHFYTANYVNEGRIGKGGCTYGKNHAFCLETQHFPDAIHHPTFPSPVLKAGDTYDHTTVFSFTAV